MKGDPEPFPSYAQLAEDTGLNHHSMTWAMPHMISSGLVVVDLPLPEPEPEPATRGDVPRRQKAVIPKDLRWAVWERDDYTCQNCGARRDLSVDHIHPESAGGPTTMENLQTLCRSCNSAKGARVGVLTAKRT